MNARPHFPLMDPRQRRAVERQTANRQLALAEDEFRAANAHPSSEDVCEDINQLAEEVVASVRKWVQLMQRSDFPMALSGGSPLTTADTFDWVIQASEMVEKTMNPMAAAVFRRAVELAVLR